MTVIKAPQHAFEFEMCVGGETWDDTIREIERLAVHVRAHGPECSMASSGCGYTSHITIRTRDVSPEDYRAELKAWMEALREEVRRENR